MKPFLLLVGILLSPITVLPLTHPTASRPVYYTDEQLLTLAIDKNIVPKNRDKAYFEQEIEKENSVTAWIVLSREKKIATIDTLKEMFLEKEGATISNPSEYYVDVVNTVLYKRIVEGGLDSLQGLKSLFLTTALMEGDYDNGKDKVELLKEHLGEKVFEDYKKDFPEKYQYLVEMEK